jgi:hypothetical protein
MLCRHWHEYVYGPTGARVRVDADLRDQLGERGAWEAYELVRAKNLPVRPLGAPLGRRCFVTVGGLDLFATVLTVAGPPDEPVVLVSSKERFLQWQEENAERVRATHQARQRGRRQKVVTPGPVPVPTSLRRLAVIRLQWGDQIIEIACTACTLRPNVRFANDTLELPCLHCSGSYLAEVPHEGDIAVRSFLVPVQYVVDMRAGPTFRLTRLLADGGDVQCFEPTQAPAAAAMAMEDIKAALAALFDPQLN